MGEVGTCLFHVVGGVGVSLLSLFPHLIKQLLRVGVVGVGVAGWNTMLLLVRTGLRLWWGPAGTPGASEGCWM